MNPSPYSNLSACTWSGLLYYCFPCHFWRIIIYWNLPSDLHLLNFRPAPVPCEGPAWLFSLVDSLGILRVARWIGESWCILIADLNLHFVSQRAVYTTPILPLKHTPKQTQNIQTSYIFKLRPNRREPLVPTKIVPLDFFHFSHLRQMANLLGQNDHRIIYKVQDSIIREDFKASRNVWTKKVHSSLQQPRASRKTLWELPFLQFAPVSVRLVGVCHPSDSSGQSPIDNLQPGPHSAKLRAIGWARHLWTP